MVKYHQNLVTRYEQKLNFNAIVSWLHSQRFRSTLKIFERFSAENPGRPIKVLDIGCAQARLFDALSSRFSIEYTGIEIHADFVSAARERVGGCPNFRLIQGDAQYEIGKLGEMDVAVALETFEHVPEHKVVRIVEEVARLAPKLFLCSVPVELGPSIWIKNVGSLLMGYDRHHEYTWAETFWAGFGQLDKLPPHGTRHKGFDWRWLAQTVRHSHAIERIESLPFPSVPASFSPTVFIVSRPRAAADVPKPQEVVTMRHSSVDAP